MRTVATAVLTATALFTGITTAAAQGVTRETTTTTTTRTTTLAPEVRTHVREYVTVHRHPSFKWGGRVAVGAVLPSDVEFYPIEGVEDADAYEYAYVDDEPVLVEPRTRKIIEVLR